MEPAQKPNRQWLSLVVVVALVAAALYLVLIGAKPGRAPTPNSTSSMEAQAPLPQPAPASISPGALYAVSYPDLHGQSTALGKWQGKVVVLNFWATWCVPCREEMPLFDRVQKKLGDADAVVIGLAADDQTKVANYLRESPVSYPILIGDFEALEFARRLGNKQAVLPYTVIINRNGQILRSKLGPYTEAELEAEIKAAL